MSDQWVILLRVSSIFAVYFVLRCRLRLDSVDVFLLDCLKPWIQKAGRIWVGLCEFCKNSNDFVKEKFVKDSSDAGFGLYCMVVGCILKCSGRENIRRILLHVNFHLGEPCEASE